MCPSHQNGGAVAAQDRSEMVNIPLASSAPGKRGTTRSESIKKYLDEKLKNPYAPRAADFLSNISNFNIIESTLRG